MPLSAIKCQAENGPETGMDPREAMSPRIGEWMVDLAAHRETGGGQGKLRWVRGGQAGSRPRLK